jgi:ParB/RepB/Spo0J family partition protein
MTDTTHRTDTGPTELRWLKREQIVIGDLQPRKHFDQAGIEEMVGSFREHGFDPGLSHLLVRPFGEVRITHEPDSKHWYISANRPARTLKEAGAGGWEILDAAESEAEAEEKRAAAELFELVLGERRYRASEIAGIELLPAIVQELTDLEVLKKQLVENMQRAELTPIEEAMAFARMRDEMGQSMEDIVQSVGIGKEVVRNRLLLSRLFGTDVAAAIERGDITATHGLALGRVPSRALRTELLQKVLHPPDGSAAPWSEDALLAHIKMDYVTDLRFAKFDQEDPNLVPVEWSEVPDGVPAERLFGGACTDCPFNTFVNPPADGGERRSVKDTRKLCTNTQCFQMKEIAAHERWRVSAIASEDGRSRIENGGEVLTLSHAENAELWNESGRALAFHSPYVELDEAPAASELRGDIVVAPTWKKLIEGQAVAIVLGRDTTGRVHELVRHDLAKKAAHLNGHKIFRDSEREERTDRERSSTAPAPAQSADERSREGTLATKAEQDEERAILAAEIAAIVAAAEGKLRRGMVQLPRAFWKTCAAALASMAYNMGHLDKVLTRRGWKFEVFLEQIDKLPLGEQLGLVAEFFAIIGGEEDREVWAEVFGVKLKAVRKKAERRLRKPDTGNRNEEEKSSSVKPTAGLGKAA